jgi:diguanylate cyclase (GGDEF)-like protein
MGAMMRANLRQHDIAGLYGGDEAVVLYPRTPLEEAMEIAEKLRLTIQERVFEHRGQSFRVTISQGLAEHPAHGETAEEIIAAADKALYAAKAKGRNCACQAELPGS